MGEKLDTFVRNELRDKTEKYIFANFKKLR